MMSVGSTRSGSKGKTRIGWIVVLVLVGVVCLSALAGITSAQQQTEDSITIEADETHEGDLEVTAGEVLVEGTVDGELTATGGSVTISGDITEDVTATAGTTIIDGHVQGDLSAVGGDVHVQEDSTIDDYVDVTGGTVRIDGQVGGDAHLDGENVTLGSTAVIDGDLIYSADRIDIDEEAEVTGDVIERDDPEDVLPDVSLPTLPDEVATLLVGLYLFLANFLLGATLLVAIPTFSEQVGAHGVSRPVLSGGVGLGTLIGTPFVLGALFFSIVGIPLALFAGYGFLFVLWIGLVYGAFVIGTWGLDLAGRSHRWGALALGLAVVSLVTVLPYLGALILVISILGLGAFVFTLYDRRTDTDTESELPPTTTTADESTT